MIGWLFEALWHAVLGLVLVIGFLGGAVFVIGREIGKGAEHDQKRCMCSMCVQRRARAWQKRQAVKEDPYPKQKRGQEWMSTEQLQTADRVKSSSGTWEIVGLTAVGNGAIRVVMKNMVTRKDGFVIVPKHLRSRKIWQMAN